MEISAFVFKILILFFPGILCSYIVENFTEHKEWSKFQFLINSYVFGFSSYIIYWIFLNLIIYCFSCEENNVAFVKAITNKGYPINYSEVLWASLIAIFLGLLLTTLSTYKLHFRLIHTLKISNKFGEQDVWEYLMNSNRTEYVTVRDLNYNLMYDGWIQAFSGNSTEPELLLGDVKVYTNEDAVHLYDVSSQYLKLDSNCIVIEIR